MLDVYHPSGTVYAEGYWLSADHLVDLSLSESSNRDFLIYPILFLYRQFLELSLKEIIIYAEELTVEGETKRRDHHRLDSLWTQVEQLMTDVSDGSVEHDVTVIGNAVRQFASIDPTSQLFRYPEEKDGTAVVFPLARVSLPRLRDEMENAGTAIQMVSGGLSARVDQHREFLGEMGP